MARFHVHISADLESMKGARWPPSFTSG